LDDDSEPPPIATFAKAFFLGLASAMYNFLKRKHKDLAFSRGFTSAII
jgi:hypothetical protein